MNMQFTKHNDKIKFMTKMAMDAKKIIKTTPMIIKNKGPYDRVTNIDILIEKHIRENLAIKYPEIEILGEEFCKNENVPKRCFVIDPIDGTSNFCNGQPLWGFQIAYIENKEAVACVIYLVSFNEMYCAVKGEGAYLNNERLKIKKAKPIESFVSIEASRNMPKYDIAKDIYDSVYACRSYSSCALSSAWLCKNLLGACLFLNVHPWDYYPGILLAKESGAKITFCDKKHVVLANSKELLDILQSTSEKY